MFACEHRDRFEPVLGNARGSGRDDTVAPLSVISGGVRLTEFLGVFGEGWDDEDIERNLPGIEAALGLRLGVVWEYFDEMGYGGHSDLVVIGPDGSVHELPENLWFVLVEDEDLLVDPSTTPTAVHPEYPNVSFAVVGRNLALEDRT